VLVQDFVALAAEWTQAVDILHIDGVHTLVCSSSRCRILAHSSACSLDCSLQEAVTNDWIAWRPHVRGLINQILKQRPIA
jgi:hypothetical protein